MIWLLLAAPSVAAELRLSSQPPSMFASGPTLVPVETFGLSLVEVNAICRDHIVFSEKQFDGRAIDACVVFSNDRTFVRWEERKTATSCVIFYAEKLFPSKAEYDSMISHETGHCRGWPPDHPGALPP